MFGQVTESGSKPINFRIKDVSFYWKVSSQEYGMLFFRILCVSVNGIKLYLKYETLIF